MFGVPFARPPQRVPLGGLGGFAGPEEVGAMSEPDGDAPIVGRSDGHWTLNVIPIFRHYFSQKASWRLERIRFISRFRRLFSPRPHEQDAIGEGATRRSVAKLTNRLSDGLLIRWPTSLTLRSRRRCFLSWKRSPPCGSAFSDRRSAAPTASCESRATPVASRHPEPRWWPAHRGKVEPGRPRHGECDAAAFPHRDAIGFEIAGSGAAR